MTSQPIYLVDQSSTKIAGLNVALIDDLYSGTICLDATPPQLKLAGPDVERLTVAGRAAWRDGEARVEGIARGALPQALGLWWTHAAVALLALAVLLGPRLVHRLRYRMGRL